MSTNSATSTPSAPTTTRRCVVISLIRHAQCTGNVYGTFQEDDAIDPLTDLGRSQAESLGKDWADVHVDHVLSSPFPRAHDTAKALSDQNNGHPEVETDDLLIERKYGSLVPRLKLQGCSDQATVALRGSLYGPLDRSHTPPGGGESLQTVAARASITIRQILNRYAVPLSEPPDQFIKKERTTEPTVLPDGIPHVVIISHNIFLSELYEKLQYWRHEYKLSRCHYRNAEWSRHILWHDKDSDELQVFNVKVCESP